MDIYLVIIEDRHADVEVTPFTGQGAAVSFAEQKIPAGAGPVDSEDRELGEAMIKDGWVWRCLYGTEGDSIRVVRRELRGLHPAAGLCDPQTQRPSGPS